MAGTHKETKQFFTLYNTLDDTKLYLGKEVRSVNLLCFAPHPPLPCASCATSFLLHFDVNRYLLRSIYMQYYHYLRFSYTSFTVMESLKFFLISFFFTG